MQQNLEAKLNSHKGLLSKIKQSIITKYFTAVLAIAGATILSAGCEGKNPTQPTQPGTQVTANIITYNHTQGERGRFTVEGMVGETKTIDIAAQANAWNVKDVNLQYGVVRQEHDPTTKQVGSFVARAEGDGIIRIRLDGTTRYELFLYNTTNGLDYQYLSATRHLGEKMHSNSRTITTRRVDEEGQTGPDSVFTEINQEFTRAANPFGIIYATYNHLGYAENAQLRVGYGPIAGYWGENYADRIIVDFSRVGHVYGLILYTYMEELFERTKSVGDANIRPTWGQMISEVQGNTMVLSPAGKDTLCFAALNAKF